MKPFFSQTGVDLYLGKCEEVLREFEPESISACITDPPYGLGEVKSLPGLLEAWMNDDCDKKHIGKSGFMNREWDAGVPSPRYWKEVYRVMKPGAHLLCFASTRTWDLMSLSIRLAGFENRDTISHEGALRWYYGSGFPKSLDVSKQIDKMAPREGMFADFAKHYAQCRKLKGLTHAQVCAAGSFYANINHGGASVNWERGHNVPTRAQWGILKPLLELSSEWMPLIERIEAERMIIGEVRHGDPCSWYGQQERGDGLADLTIPATEPAKQWEGWGTAMKPAWEVILVFRRPLEESSIARQVLSTGTGAINIDASRVGSAESWEGNTEDSTGPNGYGPGDADGWKGNWTKKSPSNPSGRFPANLLLSHVSGPNGCQRVGTKRVRGSNVPGQLGTNEGGYSGNYGPRVPYGYTDPDGYEEIESFECVEGCPIKALDDQAGIRKSGANPTRRNSHVFRNCYGEFEGQRECSPVRGAESGYVSRFFKQFHEPDTGPGFLYQAKAPASQRWGILKCECEEEQWGNRDQNLNEQTEPSLPEKATCERCGKKPKLDAHPTQKPLALMCWLVRLVTPPGGVVLDPFAGSGTTLLAALQENFQALGIEAEEEYCTIAAARISASNDQKEPSRPKPLKVASRSLENDVEAQLNLFEEGA